MTLTITKRERDLILLALTIATEDGSIYGGASGEESDRIDFELEGIRDKLGA